MQTPLQTLAEAARAAAPPASTDGLLGFVGRFRVVALKDDKVMVGAAKEGATAGDLDPVHESKRVLLTPAHIQKLPAALDLHFETGVVLRQGFKYVLGYLNERKRLKFVGNNFQGKYYLHFRIYYRYSPPAGDDDDDDDRPSAEGVSFERAYFASVLRLILDGYEYTALPRDPGVHQKLLAEVAAVVALDPSASWQESPSREPAVVPKSLDVVQNVLMTRLHGEPARRIGETLYRDHFRDLLTLCYGRIVQHKWEELNKKDDDLYRL